MPLQVNTEAMKIFLGILLLAWTTVLGVSSIGGESHGFGDHIDWFPLQEGLEKAQESQKPLMLIIHKSWCGACKAIKPKFHDSKEIGELSKKFVMVNTMDDDEPEGQDYHPDGSYIPRFLFFNSDGSLLEDITSGNPDYKYYFNSPEAIIRVMKEVISLGSDKGQVEEEAIVSDETKDAKNGSERIEL